MANFKVFKYIHAVMAQIGIHSYRLNESTNDFFKTYMTYVILFIIVAFYVIATTWHIAVKTSEFGDALDPCFVLIGGLQLGGMYVGIGLKMRKVKAIQLILQGIITNGTHNFLPTFFVFHFLGFFFQTQVFFNFQPVARCLTSTGKMSC